MKTKIIIFSMISTLLVWCIFMQVSYAYDYPPVTINRIEGTTPYFIEDTEDKIYIRLDQGNQMLTSQMYDVDFIYGLAKITTLYNTFVIANSSNQIVKTFTDFDYVEIDSLNFRNDLLVTFRTENESYVWNGDTVEGIYVYILKDIEYDPAGEDIVFITDIDLLKPVEDFNNYFVGWDNYDGELDIEIADDQYSGNKHLIGIYDVTLVLTDSSDNKKFLTYQIEVKDITAPTITPQNDISVSYTKEFDINDFISSLEIIDNVSGRDDLTISIVEDHYSENKLTLGTHDIKFEIKDESLNSTIYTQKITVIDDVSPVISGTLVYTKQAEDELTVQTLIDNLTITDVFTEHPYVSIIEDLYSNSMHELGIYTIKIKAVDNDGNESYTTLSVQVIDEVLPVFYMNLGLIQTTEQTIINQAELRTLIEQRIPVNYEYFDIVFDEYSSQNNKPGIYRVNLNVYNKDSIHNFQLLIRVNEVDSSLDQNENQNNSLNLWLIYGLSIGGLILISTTLVFFIKKKRSKLN